MVEIERVKEKEIIRDCLRAEGFEMLVLYGRRRIGKTYLLLSLAANDPNCLYLSCVEKSRHLNVQAFYDLLARRFGLPEVALGKEDGFPLVLNALERRLSQGHVTLILDEYQWLSESDPTFDSLFQSYVDRWRAKDAPISIILSGSVVSMMKGIVDDKTHPLYGRATKQLHLRAIPFWECTGFFSGFDKERAASLYMLTGGVPYYLSLIRKGDDVAAYLKRNIISPAGALREEIDALFRYELRALSPYKQVLSLLARGKNAFAELSQFFLQETSKLSSYLSTMEDKLEIIAKIQPALGGKGKERYVIVDAFIAAYFALVYPNLSDPSYVIDEDVFAKRYFTKERINAFLGQRFEALCQRFLDRQSVYGKLEYPYPMVKNHWGFADGKTIEIDLAAAKDGHYLLGECKWTSKPLEADEYFALSSFAATLPTLKDATYVFFSRAGFSSRMEEIAKEKPNVRLYGLDDLF